MTVSPHVFLHKLWKANFEPVKEMPKIFPIDTIKCFNVDKLSLGVTPRLLIDNSLPILRSLLKKILKTRLI